MSIEGGWSDWRAAGEDTQKIIDQVKGQIEERLDSYFAEIKALEVRTQLVAGTNYEIRAQADAVQILVTVFKSLGGEFSLTNVEPIVCQ